jgi:hypothetical protein
VKKFLFLIFILLFSNCNHEVKQTSIVASSYIVIEQVFGNRSASLGSHFGNNDLNPLEIIFFFLPSISTEESFGYIHLTFEFLIFYLNLAIKHNQNEIMSLQTQDKLIEFFEALDDDMNKES